MMTPEDLKVSRAAQKLASDLDRKLAKIAGKRMGFVLLTFSLDVENHHPTYISNCDRPQMQDVLRDLLNRWERGMPDIPAHKKQ